MKVAGFLGMFMLINIATAKSRHYKIDISSSEFNPDCASSSIKSMLVNGQFPAPPLYAVKGDDIEITVCNNIDSESETSIHYHGIRQYKSTGSDGVPGINQEAIAPGECYVQKFTVYDQSGTFFYHAHLGLQDETIQGPFIVYDSEDSWPDSDESLTDGPYEYDDERILQISEWWHMPAKEREAYYLGPNFTFDYGADSILMNGRTVNNPSQLAMSTCPGYMGLNVEPNKTYRLRIIGGNTFRVLGLAIKDHPMTIIEIDGTMVEPLTVSNLEITPGQRFSVLIHTKDFAPGSSFTIATHYLYRRTDNFFTENGYALLNYVRPHSINKHVLPFETVREFPEFPETDRNGWYWNEIKSLLPRNPIVDGFPDRTIKLRSDHVKGPDNSTRYRINGRPLVHHPISLYSNHMNSIPQVSRINVLNMDGYNDGRETYPIFNGEIIDLVFQNAMGPQGCLIHPWHTHGHSHYVIAFGDGEYQPEVHGFIRNIPNPLLKDTTTVYPTDPDPKFGGCGWTKVRIIADNPGFWAVHCHITTHMLQGKMAIIEESSDLIPR
ncbi:Cupredoxin [Spinellus fusiger]|nr:Cupredoxin [Spinellus fusiger]